MTQIIEQKIKAYIAPVLITIIGVMALSLITEIRSDVKSLLASKAENGIRLNELERRVGNIELSYAQQIFIKPDELKIQKRK